MSRRGCVILIFQSFGLNFCYRCPPHSPAAVKLTFTDADMPRFIIIIAINYDMMALIVYASEMEQHEIYWPKPMLNRIGCPYLRKQFAPRCTMRDNTNGERKAKKSPSARFCVVFSRSLDEALPPSLALVVNFNNAAKECRRSPHKSEARLSLKWEGCLVGLQIDGKENFLLTSTETSSEVRNAFAENPIAMPAATLNANIPATTIERWRWTSIGSHKRGNFKGIVKSERISSFTSSYSSLQLCGNISQSKKGSPENDREGGKRLTWSAEIHRTWSGRNFAFF